MGDLMKVRVQLPHGSDLSRGPGWTDLWVREGTDDEDVIQEVWILDVYHLRGLDMTRKADPDGVVRSAAARIIDIGAHAGIFTACCAQMFPDARIEAYEPNPQNYELLARNTQKWRSRVSIAETAIGASDGTVELVGEGATGHTAPGGAVQQITLDRAIGQLPVALLKIDVEGAEYAIIDAVPVERLKQVDLIHMEWHGPGMAAHLPNTNGYGDMLHKLSYTHAVNVFGRPELGGMLFAHRYPD